ncbi:hypothetical protein [Corynebacterium sp. 335C]
MGRVLLIVLVIVAIVLLWKAFGPGSRRRAQPPRGPVGPDDDPDFLWTLDKRRYDEERERRRREEEGGGPEGDG